MPPAGIDTAGRSTWAAASARGSAGRNTLGRSVTSQGALLQVTLERSLPAYTGRVATSLPSSSASAVESAESPAPSRAARRAIISRWRVVTGARIAWGDSLAASSATTGVQTSPRYAPKAAFSRSQTRFAPSSPRSFTPSGAAVSVSQTASACAPI